MLKITGGKIERAQKVVLYGPEGVGKTTFASKFPSPLFIDVEGGSGHLDVMRTERPASWAALLATVRAVRAERPCSTLVVDTADWAERLCVDSVCSRNKWESVESPGYGRGYNQAVEEFCKLLDALSEVADAGVNVVLTAHAAVRKFEQPDEAASYDRWTLKLIDGNKASAAAKVKEWADAVLFANYKTIVETTDGGKGKARGGKKRVVHTTHAATWDAKNRWGLPDEIPMEFERIAPHVPDMTRPSPAAPPAAPDVDVLGRRLVPAEREQPAESGAVGPARSEAEDADALPEWWAPALQLMAGMGATVDEVREIAARKGHFTADTPASSFPREYVDGCIVAQWPKWREEIERLREEREPVPFD